MDLPNDDTHDMRFGSIGNALGSCDIIFWYLLAYSTLVQIFQFHFTRFTDYN